MTNQGVRLITIFTEAALESQLIKDIESFDVQGYTITNARGKGSRGTRGAFWEANSNIRLEIICGTNMADQISKHIQNTYYDNYAMVSFSSEIDVLRPEKFSG